MKHPNKKIALLTLLVLLATNTSHAEQASIPPEVMQQLQALSQRVAQLEAQLAKQQQLTPAPAATPVTVAEDVTDLKQRVKLVERKQQLVDEEAKQTVVASDKGFGLRSADGKFEMKLRGLIQSDARVFDEGIKGQHAYLGDTPAQQNSADDATHNAINNFIVRRARPTMEGTFNDIYGFRITADYGNGTNSSTNLVDAYIDANFDPAFKIRTGKFTPPIGIERLQSSSDNKFNELGLQSNFIPSRDQGAQISGDIFGKTLNYSVGIFNGAMDGASGSEDSNTDKEIDVRLFATPFVGTAGFLQGLGFGVGTSKTDSRGASGNTGLTTYKTSGQENFYSYRTDTSASNTVFANGDRTRLVPQMSYYNGGLGVTSEYVMEQQDITRVYGAAANQLRTEQLDNKGWDLTASYLLTGEKASYKGVKPSHEFDPANGGWGAWELVARVGELNIDKGAFYDSNGVLGGNDSFAQATKSAKDAKNYGIGVNWYLNNVLRLSLDYDQTSFDWGGGGTAQNPINREDERVMIGRIQASF